MTVLVTGGAGYVGSHMAWRLTDLGETVVVLDNLSTGLRRLVPQAVAFVKGEVGDMALVERIIVEHAVDAIIHFAGSIVVPESVSNPLLYYANNVSAARNLMAIAVAAGVKFFVFSSTAAVYGMPTVSSVAEDAATSPINPYGRSKLMTEWMLADTARAHDFRYVALRYFNVAGADTSGRTGQSLSTATHLIKRACLAALGRIPELDIFGTDYPTRDGTGVRDYIHVCDLIDAHVLALQSLRNGGASATFNCGYGRGSSVREVIEVVEQVTGTKFLIRERPRRPGDPAELIADSRKIVAELGWRPKYDDLSQIVRSSYTWEKFLNA